MKCLLLPLLLALTLGALHAADDMPAWAIPGILAVESSSHYNPDGSISYVDRRVGAAGELGCCQITPTAFHVVALPGETFVRCSSDPIFCVAIAQRYLRWIYEHKAGRDWLRTVGMYNAGFGTDRRSINRRIAYLIRVRKAGTK